MDVNTYLLSRYADGEATPEEAAAIEQALATDETLAAEHEDLRLLAGLFGHGEPDEISPELEARLCALRPIEKLERFEVVPGGARKRPAWTNWAVAAAAVLLCLVGLQALTHRPEVVLRDVTRLSLLPNGHIAQANRHVEVARRAGDALETRANERLSFLLPDGSLVVLMPGSRMALGNAEAGDLLELERGAVLCNVREQASSRRVRAAGFSIDTDDADFGVRVEGAELKAAGASAAASGRVAVTVSRGSVEVAENGARAKVEEFSRLVWRRGEPARTGHAAEDPSFKTLMGKPFRPFSREAVPGYFTGERGVTVLDNRRWVRSDGARVLVLTDGGAEAAGAQYLVLWVRAEKETPLHVTRIRPLQAGRAETVTVPTAAIGPAWTVVAVPLGAFTGPDAVTGEMKIDAGRSRLMRLQLKPADPKIQFELRSSLWAERPPARDNPEVVR